MRIVYDSRVPNLRDYYPGTVGNGGDDTASFLAWQADINAIVSGDGERGCRSMLPSGDFILTSGISFDNAEHLFDTAGGGATVWFEPDTAAYDTGGKVIGDHGVGMWLSRYLTHTISEGDRIVVGGAHYALSNCREAASYPLGTATRSGSTVTFSLSQAGVICDGMNVLVDSLPYVVSGFDGTTGCTMAGAAWSGAQAVTALASVLLAGTVSRTGNAATFSTSQAGQIENGSNLSIDGAGYIVEAFNGTTGATLKKSGGADATFANGSTITANRFIATITALDAGATTFSAATYTMPHTHAFRWRKPNLTPWNSMQSLIGRVRVRGFTLRSTDTTNMKVGLDFWDSSHCIADGLRFDFGGNGALGTATSVLTPSVGVRTTGRELFRLHQSDIAVDQPAEYRALIGELDTSIDGFETKGCLLLPKVAGKHAVRIRAGAGGKTFKLDHVNAVGGAGIVKHDGDTNSMQGVSIRACESEQHADPTAHVIDWVATTQRLTISDCSLGGVVNEESAGGIRVRNVNGLKIAQTLYLGGYTSLAAWTVSSITRSGSTATLTLSAAHGVTVGDLTSFTIAGAAQTEYNGLFVGTAAGTTTVTFTVTGTPATPATGTITATRSISYKSALDVNDTVDDIKLEGYYMTSGSTTNLADYHESMLEMPRINSNAPVAPDGHWARTAAMAAGDGRFLKQGGVVTEYIDESVSYGGTYACAMNLSGGAKQANVDLTFRSPAVNWAVSSITRSGATATMSITTHGAPIGQSVRLTISGAGQAEYNGVQDCAVTDANTMTFTVGGTPASPATGTITAVVAKRVAQWTGVWADGVMYPNAQFGDIEDDGSTPEHTMCFDLSAAALTIHSAWHYPPAQILGTISSTRSG